MALEDKECQQDIWENRLGKSLFQWKLFTACGKKGQIVEVKIVECLHFSDTKNEWIFIHSLANLGRKQSWNIKCAYTIIILLTIVSQPCIMNWDKKYHIQVKK